MRLVTASHAAVRQTHLLESHTMLEQPNIRTALPRRVTAPPHRHPCEPQHPQLIPALKMKPSSTCGKLLNPTESGMLAGRQFEEASFKLRIGDISTIRFIANTIQTYADLSFGCTAIHILGQAEVRSPSPCHRQDPALSKQYKHIQTPSKTFNPTRMSHLVAHHHSSSSRGRRGPLQTSFKPVDAQRTLTMKS